MIYNPTVNNCVKHNKYQPHFSAKLSLVSLSLFSALSAPAWADNVTLTQEEYNTLINRITQLEQKMGENTNGSTTVGKNSQAALFGTAVGMNAQATGKQSTTVGVNSEASGSNSAAIGLGSKATKTDTIAMGTNSQATEINTTALGAYAEATNQYGIAVGADAYSVGQRAIAIGVHTSKDEMKKFYDDPNKLREFLNYDSTIKSNITDQAIISELTNAKQGETKLAELIKDDARLKQLIPDQKKRDAFIAYAKSVAEARATLDKQKELYPKNPELARFGLANPFGATGGKAIAIGDESLASGSYSVALGAKSKATNYASIATGYEAKATGVQTLANGFAAEATGDFSLAVGTSAKAIGNLSSAFGYASSASGIESIAMGNKAKVINTFRAVAEGNKRPDQASDSSGSIAIGRNAQSNVGLSIAIGADALNSYGDHPSLDPTYSGQTAVGVGAKTGSNGATGIGNQIRANTEKMWASDGRYRKWMGATAIGQSSQSQGLYATAVGNNSRAMGHYSISIGLQNQANKNLVPNNNYNEAGARGYISNAIGAFAYARGRFSNAIGAGALAIYNETTAIGDRAFANAANSIAIGAYSETTATNSIALGYNAVTSVDSSVALGDTSLANTMSDKIGYNPILSLEETVSSLSQLKGNTTNSTGVEITKLSDYQIQRDIIKQADKDILDTNEELKTAEYKLLYAANKDEWDVANNIVKVNQKKRDDAILAKNAALAKIKSNYNDANTWRSSAGAVSVGNSDLGITRQITNVAAGSEDTDAVNVAQLKALATAPVLFYNGGSSSGANFNIGTQLGSPFNLTNLRFSFGNGLKASLQKDGNNNQVLFMELDSDAIKTNPDLKGQNGRDGRDGQNGRDGKDGQNGRDGRDGRDGNSLTPNDIVNVKEVHTGNTVMNTNGVTINKSGKTVSITENGLDNGGNKVVNVAAGEISATSKEAVNGQQLYETNQSVAQNTRSINQLNNRMDEVDRRGRRGAAIAGAMGLLPQPHTSGRSSISTATTYYRGEQALAVGYSRLTDNGKHIVKFSGASNMSGKKDVMVGAAYGYEW